MTFCTPPCQHQDYCAYYGCPFMREPQSFCTRDRREAMPHHARGTHPVDRPGLSVLGKREGPSRKTEQGAGTTLNAHEPGTRSFSSGVGPGHHQPRSMTRRFALRPQPASGRARDRAIGPADSRFQFGCVNTGPNPQSMTGRKASTKSGPQSLFWIVRSDVTAAANSQVAA